MKQWRRDYASIQPLWRMRLLLLLIVVVLAAIVGARDVTVGTDTLTYAKDYMSLHDGMFEPGFSALAQVGRFFGVSVEGYFFTLSLIIFMLCFVVVERVSKLFACQSRDCWKIEYLVVAFFLLSPFFVSAHINAIRQGISSLIVYYALLCAFDKQWWRFLIAALVSMSFHYSAVMYLACSALMFLPLYVLLGCAGLLSVSYATGLSEFLVKYLSTEFELALYDQVVNFSQGSEYDSGVRYDFLVFSWFWVLVLVVYVLNLAAPIYRAPIGVVLKIYVVLIIPFMVFGFGNYSNRYLFSAWLFLSLMIGVACYSFKVPIVAGGLLLKVFVGVASGLFVLSSSRGWVL